MKCRIDDPVFHGWVLQAEAFCLFLWVQFFGNNVQKQYLNANVCEMTGDARAHNSRAKDGYAFNGTIHVKKIEMVFW